MEIVRLHTMRAPPRNNFVGRIYLGTPFRQAFHQRWATPAKIARFAAEVGIWRAAWTPRRRPVATSAARFDRASEAS